MGTQSGPGKRPTCPSCSKPTRICLCDRLQTPKLDNSVNVTILQHSLEKKHPLNSTRIATIGLKNVDVVTVSDVNFQAQFLIWLLESSFGSNGAKQDENRHVFDEVPRKEEDGGVTGRKFLGDNGSGDLDLDGKFGERNDFDGAEIRTFCKNSASLSGNVGDLTNKSSNSEPESCSDEAAPGKKRGLTVVREVVETCGDKNEVTSPASEAVAINFTIGKYGAISSFDHCRLTPNQLAKLSFDQLLISETVVACMRRGFVVKKFQKMPLLEGGNVYEESGIAVPPGSILLFPSEESVDVETSNYEVKNLIVLDGTWAKAKRMYNENPWLKFLPHIRLDADKLSLYSEVRRQPRAGYLSTIESIVYAMKAVGEECEGLDSLLDVFESMVGDQRRCKNERLSKTSEIPAST